MDKVDPLKEQRLHLGLNPYFRLAAGSSGSPAMGTDLAGRGLGGRGLDDRKRDASLRRRRWPARVLVPKARAWEQWDSVAQEVRSPGGTAVVVSRTVIEVALPLVTSQETMRTAGHDISSRSSLRFRGRSEVGDDLAEHGFEVVEVRGAPDRPGKELVFLARRRDR
jgi:hypothetical protein